MSYSCLRPFLFFLVFISLIARKLVCSLFFLRLRAGKKHSIFYVEKCIPFVVVVVQNSRTSVVLSHEPQVSSLVWTVDHSLVFISICRKPARFRAMKKKIKKIRVSLRSKARKKNAWGKARRNFAGKLERMGKTQDEREQGRKGEVVRWVWMCEYVQEEK